MYLCNFDHEEAEVPIYVITKSQFCKMIDPIMAFPNPMVLLFVAMPVHLSSFSHSVGVALAAAAVAMAPAAGIPF